MALTPGTRLGVYDIVAPLGAGGMGEVYRARDAKLGRDVALKILPDTVAQDTDRIARFKREAQVLAALNHPHIAAIYGFDEAGTTQFLVLELVEGETLADRLKRGPIPVDETIVVARQIAEALEEAHEKGIIHRDLKPANVAFTAKDQVKVLDFGLAKLAAAPAGAAASSASMSPTLTTPAMTAMGMILGTAAYMSPEQAKGRDADKRSDLWAFGCVVFEMLTAKRAFEGEDITDTIAAIMRGEPDWKALPAETPANVRLLVELCLTKDRRQRAADIAVAQFLLGDRATLSPASASSETAPPATVAAPARTGRPWTMAIASGVACTALAVLAAWLVLHQTPQKLQSMRFSIVPPATEPFNIQGFYRNLAISPDGTHVVYVAGSESQLMVRAIDQLEAVPLRGITSAAFPFISPDGRWVGFAASAGGELKKVSTTGGPPITLCRFPGTFRGASWGPDDTIVFATNDTSTGLFAVSSGGGEPKVLTKPDTSHGELDHLFPFTLPGGHAVLFTISASGGNDNAQVAVLDLKTGQRKTLVRGGSDAVYVDTGHLVYASAGTLRAVRFDPSRLEVLSDPVPVLEQVTTLGTGAADFRVSQNGTLVYVPGTLNGGGAARSLVWVNRQGREEPTNAPPRTYFMARLSPDGTRVALDIRDQESDIWIWDLGRQTLTRLTFDPRTDGFPVWTPDGKRIVFGSERAGAGNVYWQAADGTGTVERLVTSPNPQLPTSIAPDGKSLVVQDTNPKTLFDLMLLTLDGSRRIEPLVQTAFAENSGEISPDGHWLAYQSNESGRTEVYVRSFPKVDGGRWQISTGGGSRPAWSPTGRELFYLGQNLAMMAVAVLTAPTFSAGNPSKLFDGQWFAPPGTRPYDVSRDGQRFLMIKDAMSSGSTGASPTITVVLNWFEELKARVPAK